MWTFGKAGGNKTRRNYGNRRLIQFLLCGPSWKDSRSPSVMFAQRRLAEKDTDTLMDLLDGKAGNAFLNDPVPIFMRTRFLQPLRSALVKKASIGKCTTICSAKSPRPKMKFRRLVRVRECADSATGPSAC